MSKKLFLLKGFVLLLLNVFSQTAFKQNLQYAKANTFAGIEVGSKGVKISILEAAKNPKTNGSYKLIKDSSINTDFINFDSNSFNSTLMAFVGLYQTALNAYQISNDKIFTVISSGVKGQSERENRTDWVNDFIDSFKQRINEPIREVNIIDVAQEARLSHLGIVPNERRYTTFLIDIGSGNTKGGYFPNGNTKDFKLFDLNWGTKSVANETEKRSLEDKTLINYNRQLKRVLAGAVSNELVYAVNASNAYAMNDYVAISGGIAWSVATLMYPELGSQSIIPVTYDDVAFFLNKIAISIKPYEAASISKLIEDTNPDKNNIVNEINRVHKVFDQRALLSGGNLLLNIMRQFSGVEEKKLFYLVKNGQVGWVSAYVEMNKNKYETK